MMKLLTIALLFSLFASAQKPAVSFRSPAKDTVIESTGPVEVLLAASASDLLGIRNVKFYANNALLFTEAVDPFEQAWKFDTGTHTLKIIATNTIGITTQTSLRLTVKRPLSVTEIMAKKIDSLEGVLSRTEGRLGKTISDSLNSLRIIDLYRHITPGGKIDGVNTKFTVSGNIVAGTEQIWIGWTGGLGGYYVPASAYTTKQTKNNLEIIFKIPPPVGTWIEIEILK